MEVETSRGDKTSKRNGVYRWFEASRDFEGMEKHRRVLFAFCLYNMGLISWLELVFRLILLNYFTHLTRDEAPWPKGIDPVT